MKDGDAVMVHKNRGWDEINEVEPDEFDLEMMADIDINPDCKEFISDEELVSRRYARE